MDNQTHATAHFASSGDPAGPALRWRSLLPCHALTGHTQEMNTLPIHADPIAEVSFESHFRGTDGDAPANGRPV